MKSDNDSNSEIYKLTNEDNQGPVVARPHYLLGKVNTPMLYWINNLVKKSSNNLYQDEINANPELVNDLLISIFDKSWNEKYTIKDFLNDHYENYCDTLMGHESEQPFFDYLLKLVTDYKSKLRRKAYKELCSWISTHNDYDASQSPKETIVDSSGETHNLSLRQIALVIFRNELNVRGPEAEKLMRTSKHKYRCYDKMQGYHNRYYNDSSLKIADIEGREKTDMRRNLLAAYPWLHEKAQEEAIKELRAVWPDIKIPV
jgi:hypothetical protein